MKPVDIIVMVLAFGVMLAICLPLIGIVLNDENFDPERAELLKGLVISVLAIVSMYVGARLNDRNK